MCWSRNSKLVAAIFFRLFGPYLTPDDSELSTHPSQQTCINQSCFHSSDHIAAVTIYSPLPLPRLKVLGFCLDNVNSSLIYGAVLGLMSILELCLVSSIDNRWNITSITVVCTRSGDVTFPLELGVVL